MCIDGQLPHGCATQLCSDLKESAPDLLPALMPEAFDASLAELVDASLVEIEVSSPSPMVLTAPMQDPPYAELMSLRDIAAPLALVDLLETIYQGSNYLVPNSNSL